MKQHILTTASFYFTNSWARFMSTGYFVLGKYREMEWMCRSQSGTAASPCDQIWMLMRGTHRFHRCVPRFLQHSEKRSGTYDSDDRAWAAGRCGDAAFLQEPGPPAADRPGAGGENLDDPAHRADSQDIRATRDCLKSLREGEGSSRCWSAESRAPHCGSLIPVALTLRGGGVFRGRGRLMDRPQEPYFRIFDGMGITHRREGTPDGPGPAASRGVSHAGDVSSQFVTGLLFALPLLEGGEHHPAHLPAGVQRVCGHDPPGAAGPGHPGGGAARGFRVPGGQQYGRGTLGEEADYSQAAFWLAAAGLGSPLTVEGLDPDSTQGDRCVVPYFQQLAGPGRVELDIAQCPDLAPALAVRAALRPGQTARLVNAGGCG